MKRLATPEILLPILIALVFTGCNDRMLDEIMNRKGLAKKARLDEMAYQGRHYKFTYDKKGLVDNIEAHQNDQLIYTYEVTYGKNKKLSSAALVEDGAVVSENHNFVFDNRGNITEFTYTWYVEGMPEGASTVHYLEYDEQNRIVSISTDPSSSGTEYTYDSRDNVALAANASTEITYTYDDKLNPLNRIPDLMFLFVEEQFIWEFVMSKNNSLTRHYFTRFNNQTEHTTYVNEYDKYYRLVRKADYEGNTFTFIYN